MLQFASAQVVVAQDTLRLSHGEFLAIVKQYHPLAFKYRLENQIAKAEVQQARGYFDPVLSAKDGKKTIDGVDYYQESNVGLEIPTWYGVSLSGSYNNIEGQRLNNSDTRGGLYQFGVTVPLAKGLLFDQQRALLQQARAALQMTAAEQQLLTNALFRDAETTYWDWVRYYEIYRLQTQAVDINVKRLDMIKRTFDYGERAAIDTTEALAQLRSYELEQEDAYLQFLKATAELSLFLWKDQYQPFDLRQPIVPTDELVASEAFKSYPLLITKLNTTNLNAHLSLVYYQQKGSFLETERRLKWQSFLPKLDFTYNFFNKEGYQSEYFPLFHNNYQYGLKLEIPVFLRQARAGYQMAKAKIGQNQMDLTLKEQELQVKISNYSNEVQNYNAQINLAGRNLENYQRLLQGEEARYGNGESSLFLINSRQNKLIEAQEKVIELRFKFLKGYAELKYLAESF
ncbi:transporter [Pedobacter quisquiliarum]|uniref:Transporter n=2 Tax=Pedobacter quisquiliarum TaxID=1834438 RepID=A0A916X7Y8_9SPHI|nr:transporter [Pedobacter quisquiliarum]